jgi:hypothetical protein
MLASDAGIELGEEALGSIFKALLSVTDEELIKQAKAYGVSL